MEKKKRIAAVVLGGIVVFTLFWGWRHFFSTDSTAIEASGTIEATTVELNAKVAGTLHTILVQSGQEVKKDQTVAEITRNDLLAQLERDQLAVVKAEKTLADLVAGARPQELNEAAAQVNIARVNLKRAEDDLQRIKTLAEAGAVSQVDLENVQTSYEILQNQLQAAEARLSLLQEGSRPEQVNAAQVEVERSTAVLKASEALVADLKIQAPVDGVVLSRNYEPGEYVQMGSPVVSLVKMDDLWIKVYLPTDDLPRIRLGDKVHFRVSGLDQTFEGVVEEIATKGEYTPKTIQTKKERTNIVYGVKIRIDSQEGVLKPGMPADVVFDGGMK